jgi:glucokinase
LSIYERLPDSRPTRILAGDIGGTHSRLAIYSHEAGGLELLHQQIYPSSEHSGLLDVLAVFLENHDNVDAACIGLPAPIHSGLVYPLPNLEWEIDREQVLQVVGTDRVALINDVVASAAGIQGLSDDNVTCLHPGNADPEGNRIVVSVGTGLGVSALAPSGWTFATEAGHTSFSPRCELDFKLLARLQSEFGHVSWERVASGPALPRIHAMLASERSPSLGASEIVNRSDSDPVCREAVELFRGYIGAAAGNIAMNLMASGGLYLTGGVASRVIDLQSIDPFIRSFCDKGRMRSFLEQIPIYIIGEVDFAVRGAEQTALAVVGPHRGV